MRQLVLAVAALSLALLLPLLLPQRAHAQQAPQLAAEEAPSPPSASDDDAEVTSWRSKLEALGSYERSAVRYALNQRKLRLLEDPQGKSLGRIHVVNIDVFGKAEGILRLANFLHITTREHVIEREVLLRPGELWDEEVVAETQRKLKDPLFTSLVVLLPVQSADPSKVDLLVVTRDIWSLRANSTFEVLQGKLTGLGLSIAENNILGLRKHGAFVFRLDQSNFDLGPQYVDKALLGSRLQLVGRLSAIFGRESRDFEGTASSISLNYPLWSLRQKWGGGVTFDHFDSTVRFFQGTEVELYDNQDTPEIEEVPRTYEFRTIGFESHVVRSFGRKVKQSLTTGHTLSVRRPDFVDDFPTDQTLRDAFREDVFPRSERSSSLFASYALFTPKFVVYRNLNSYDLAEDVRLGPTVSLRGSAALKLIGSEENFYRASASASYVLDIQEDGFARAASGVSTRVQDGELIDNVVSSSLKIAGPRIANAVRLVGQASLSMRLRDRANGRFTLGGESGLRGYVISEFIGQRRILTNLELRSMPLRLLFARVGGLVFWDMGHAADRLGDLRMKHGVGLGFRYLMPQLQPVVFRLDWAIPLQGPSAGFPGRISAGVAQVF